jgi:SAM-dependent methyltransferase
VSLAPTERFSSRVENYERYRPGYPPGVTRLLAGACGLTPASLVADVGCGTGLLARAFLEQGHRVLGIEPNGEMRAAGARLLAGFPHFTAIEGAAEATTLPDASVDLVTAGQAFHWFAPTATRREFARVLKPDGWVALVWNERRAAGSAFLEGFDALLRRYAPEYEASSHRKVEAAAIAAFFAPGRVELRQFETAQVFDEAGIAGRLLSSSYAPEPGHPNHRPMLAALSNLVARSGRAGRVTLAYDTKVWFGRLR